VERGLPEFLPKLTEYDLEQFAPSGFDLVFRRKPVCRREQAAGVGLDDLDPEKDVVLAKLAQDRGLAGRDPARGAKREPFVDTLTIGFDDDLPVRWQLEGT
jgi:hypothetical protein